MKTGICSALTMGGLLMDADPVLGFRRQPPKGRRRVQLNRQEHVLPGFRPWFLKAFSLSGLMRMASKELKPPCLQSIHFSTIFFSFILFLYSNSIMLSRMLYY